MYVKLRFSSKLIHIVGISIHKSSVYSSKREKIEEPFSILFYLVYNLKAFQKFSLTPALDNNTEISQVLHVISLKFEMRVATITM